MTLRILLVLLAVYLSGCQMITGYRLYRAADNYNTKSKSLIKLEIITELKTQIDHFKDQIGQETVAVIKSKIDQLAANGCENSQSKLNLSQKTFDKLHKLISRLQHDGKDDQAIKKYFSDRIQEENEKLFQQIKTKDPSKTQGYDSLDMTGSNWTVILQYTDRTKNYSMNSTTRHQGFGSSNSDFYIGLDELHHLTQEKDYELHARMEMMDGTIETIRRTHFKINDDYTLSSGGTLSGNVTQESYNLIQEILVSGTVTDWKNLRCVKLLIHRVEYPKFKLARL